MKKSFGEYLELLSKKSSNFSRKLKKKKHIFIKLKKMKDRV